MNYLLVHTQGIVVSHGPYKKEVLPITPKQYINQLLALELTNFEGRIKALQKISNQQRNVPLFINEHIMLYNTMNLRHQRNCCINYLNILSLKRLQDNETLIIFKDLCKLRLSVPLKKLISRHKQCEILLNKLIDYKMIENVF